MCRWEDNTRMDDEEIGVNTKNWIHSTEGKDYRRALLNVELKLRIPQATMLVHESGV